VRDLAMRGLSCLLVEQGDLGTGTTGHFHGLLHSGGRYVVSDPDAARECIVENRVVRRIAAPEVEDTGGIFCWLDGDDHRAVGARPQQHRQRGPTPGDELGQQAEEEHRHLGVRQVADQALAEGAPRACAGPPRAGMLTAVAGTDRRPQGLRAEHHQVGRAGQPQDRERRPGGDQQGGQAGAGHDRPGGLARRHAQCRAHAGAAAAQEGVLDRQRRVLARRHDHDDRHRQEGGKVGHREGASGRRSARSGAFG